MAASRSLANGAAHDRAGELHVRELRRQREQAFGGTACGHRLQRLGISTPRPVALLETRRGLATVAYLVSEDLGTPLDLSQAIAEDGYSGRIGREVAGLFRGLGEAGLVHGDTKASNFLVSGNGVSVVDLDAMKRGSQARSRDVARFLANWDDAPEVRESFRGALQEAGVPL